MEDSSTWLEACSPRNVSKAKHMLITSYANIPAKKVRAQRFHAYRGDMLISMYAYREGSL
jgi:hypothetical protein